MSAEIGSCGPTRFAGPHDPISADSSIQAEWLWDVWQFGLATQRPEGAASRFGKPWYIAPTFPAVVRSAVE